MDDVYQIQRDTLERIDDELSFIYRQIKEGYIGNILQAAVNIQIVINRIVWYLNYLNNNH